MRSWLAAGCLRRVGQLGRSSRSQRVDDGIEGRAVKVGRRSGRPAGTAVARPHLEGDEHGATLAGARSIGTAWLGPVMKVPRLQRALPGAFLDPANARTHSLFRQPLELG